MLIEADGNPTLPSDIPESFLVFLVLEHKTRTSAY